MSLLAQHRVMTALITPFTPQGEIDLTSLARLVKQQEAAQNAILLLGSTGEGLALSHSDKKAVLSAVFAFNPKVPIIIGVGGFQLPEQLDWIEYCQTHFPVAGFLLVTPIYAKPGVQGQIHWFTALMNTAQVPCILYNVPGRTAVKLYPEVLAAVVKHSQFAGLKEASGDLTQFSAYRDLMPGHLLYSGNDEMLAAQVEQGAFGVISVTANVWPVQTKAYLNLCLTQKNTPELDQVWENVANALFWASNPVPLKILLQREGMIASNHLLPPLSAADLAETQIEKLLALSHKIRTQSELQT